MIQHELTLDYTLNPGWLEPFVLGLKAGKAIARKCNQCTYVSFPPSRVCRCGATSGSWETLTGRAWIVARTSGSDGDFALVQFIGADTQSVAKLCGIPTTCQDGCLMIAAQELPEISLGPMSKGAPHD